MKFISQRTNLISKNGQSYNQNSFGITTKQYAGRLAHFGIGGQNLL